MGERSSPLFPIYIPTKGRHEYLLTSKELGCMKVPHYLIVEPQEVEQYATAVSEAGTPATILPLDMGYKERYDTCDVHGLSKGTGSGPARNFAWDHSSSLGHPWHWVVDDNIRGFYRLKGMNRWRVQTGAFFRVMEDFCLRYENVAMAGPQYKNFAPTVLQHSKWWLPFYPNRRIFSCILIRNDVPFRWRGRYNEDVILSLDVLKAGWCTVLFYAMLQDKMGTQTMKGGNTDELYQAEYKPEEGKVYAPKGTLAKSQMLVDVHPDVSKVTWRYGRWHHVVNYRPFKKNKLRLKRGVELPHGIDEYGMTWGKLSKSKPARKERRA